MRTLTAGILAAFEGTSVDDFEAQFFNNAPEPLEDSLKAIDEIGGPKHFNHYPWGWTWAGNSSSDGGSVRPTAAARATRSSSPGRRTSRPEVRTQYVHLIDMVPTVLDLLGMRPPSAIRGVTQSPLHGVSFAHTLDDAKAESNHHTQCLARPVVHRGREALRPGDVVR